MVVVEQNVKPVLRQVGRIFRHQLGVIVFRFADQKPADVRPPGAFARRVRVAGPVGELMVNPMRCDPENRAALQRQGSANSQEILQYDRQLVRAVGVQTVITHTDAQTDTDPVEHSCRQQTSPAKHKKGGKGPKM